MKKIILISTLNIGLCLAAVPLTKIDNQTKLEWQNNFTKRPWIDSINYCKDLTLYEKTDWRLPNINELESIVNREKSNKHKLFFNALIKAKHWTSSSYAGNKSNAWSISFLTGEQTIELKSSYLNVRCVRDY